MISAERKKYLDHKLCCWSAHQKQTELFDMSISFCFRHATHVKFHASEGNYISLRSTPYSNSIEIAVRMPNHTYVVSSDIHYDNIEAIFVNDKRIWRRES